MARPIRRLDLLGDTPDWRDLALCAEVGGDLWHPEPGHHGREAKRICRRCPVRIDCLEYALARDEEWGIYGGLSRNEREALKRKAA